MDDNKKKNEYSTGFNSAFDFPDFDSLSRAPGKEEIKEEHVPAEIDLISVKETEEPAPVVVEEPIVEEVKTEVPAKKKKSKAFAPVCILLILAIIACNIFTVFSVSSNKDDDTNAVDVESYNEFAEINANYKNTTYPSGILDNLAKCYAANNDTAGWLYIPGTNVNTPVLKAKNNEKYLRRNFFDTYTTYGQAFLDYKCSSTSLSKNMIIYGHNMPAGTHFYDVNRFEDIEWYKKHPTITYYTLSGTYTYLIYTAYYSTVRGKADNGYVFNYIVADISDSKFTGYIEQVNQRALYKTSVDLKASDKIITLSTCNHTYDKLCGQRVDSRLVVIGRLLRSGESAEVDTSKAKSNPDYRKPQVYYTYKGKTNPYKNATQWRP